MTESPYELQAQDTSGCALRDAPDPDDGEQALAAECACGIRAVHASSRPNRSIIPRSESDSPAERWPRRCIALGSAYGEWALVGAGEKEE